ncbi:carbohydrate ABC transporter permease [Brevibacterium casei]|uniref:Raffinose/stachyose/melibiose transport system permease protein n=2 Tax=Brevibacterium casei TaxID=33889 RepID=A0A2H1HTQ4_9MICO|nr:carbohydrate ABC transporter permease [Brevibacterium casei]MCT1550653.1 carbohydrate ABC transporter permease [Brevibacterium casei]MCT1559883.1 carbohydrate ABC transporter permease [Brevibacterium casei]MCT2206623.1 carbohydrate ABC transporter permease [Brevibacterium casei]MCT2356869.1 carbohydrate ABC transporter permease [Brevibacterium casei]QPR38369.1 carbohydrate ABC transporter permease [Brevibacterium casei]
MSATPTVIPGSSAPTRPLSLDVNRTKAGTRRRRRRGFGLTLLLAACSLTVLVPLYVTVSMALKSGSQAVDGEAFALPAPPSLEGIIEAWSLTNFPRAFAISVFVTTVTVVGTILLSSMAAYAISRNWHRRVFRWSFFYLLAAMFLPFPVLALSQVKLSGMVGLANPFGVAILHILFQLSFSVMLYTAFLRGLPEELEESARLDGASTAQVFWRIVFPLLAPMSATVGIFSFLASWNDFMMPSLIIADPSLQTLPVVQSIFQTQFSNNYHVAFSSYLMAMAPAVIVYLFTQRWVMSGVTQGAVK